MSAARISPIYLVIILLSIVLLIGLAARMGVLAAPIKPVEEDIYRGVQIPDSSTLTRLDLFKPKFNWIKFQYVAGSSQPIKQWVGEAKRKGYKVMVSVAKNEFLKLKIIEGDICEDSLDNGYGKFRTYMASLAGDLGGSVDAYEIWNEPNLAREWTDGLGTPDPKKYSQLLKCGASGVRQANPEVAIISAGLSPLGEDFEGFLNEIVSGEASGSFDFLGAHVYSSKNLSPEDVNSDFNTIATYFGRGKKVWVSEFGWQACDAQINVSRQRDYINKAFYVANQKYKSDLEGMIVYNFGFSRLRQEAEFRCFDIESGTQGGSEPRSAGLDPNAREEPVIIVSRNTQGELEEEYYGKKKSDRCPPGRDAKKSQNDSGLVDYASSNSRGMAERLVSATLPEAVVEDLNDVALSENNKTAVKDEFFIGGLKNLACAVLANAPGFCQLNVKSTDNIDKYAEISKTLALSEKPAMDYYPSENDCNIADLEGGESNDGNKRLNEISAFELESDQPEFADLEEAKRRCLELDNLTSGSKQMPVDERLCLRVIQDQVKHDATFPEGVDVYTEKNSEYLKSISGQ